MITNTNMIIVNDSVVSLKSYKQNSLPEKEKTVNNPLDLMNSFMKI